MTSWPQFAFAVLAAAAFLLLPGYPFARALRFDRIHSFSLAPLASLLFYTIIEIAYGAMGFPCSWASVLLPALAVGVVALLVSRIVQKRRADEPDAEGQQDAQDADAEAATDRRGGTLRSILHSPAPYFFVGVLYALFVYIATLGSPNSFIQAFDNAHHLNLVRSMLESNNWSTLMSSLDPAEPGGYYPSVWSATVAMVADATKASIPACANAVNAIFVALVFPAGAYAFCRQCFGAIDRHAVACGSLIFLTFTAIPWMQLRYGPLYPNMVGFTMLPATYAVLLSLFGIGEKLSNAPSLLIASLVCLCAVALSHPSAFFTAAVFAIVPMGYGICTLIAKTKLTGATLVLARIVAVVAFAIACVGIWAFVHNLPFMSSVVNQNYGAQASWPGAVAAGLLLKYPHFWYQLPLALLVIIGFASALRSPKLRWLALCYVLVIGLFIANMGLEMGLVKSYLTGFWYNHATRLAASSAIVAIPLAALGLERISSILSKALSRRKDTGMEAPTGAKHARLETEQSAADDSRGLAFAIFALLLALIVVSPVTVTTEGFGASPMGKVWARLNAANSESNSRTFFKQDERDFSQEASELAEPDALILNNPYDGSVFAYALYGTDIYYRSFSISDNDENNALRGNICDIAENPDVAKAVQEEGIGYVLVLDRDGEEGNTIYSNTYDEEEWQGLYSITDETPGFEVALEQDDMRLYRIKPATTTDEQE